MIKIIYLFYRIIKKKRQRWILSTLRIYLSTYIAHKKMFAKSQTKSGKCHFRPSNSLFFV